MQLQMGSDRVERPVGFAIQYGVANQSLPSAKCTKCVKVYCPGPGILFINGDRLKPGQARCFDVWDANQLNITSDTNMRYEYIVV